MSFAVAMGSTEPVPGASALRILAVDDNRGEFLLLESSFAACGAAVELTTATTGHLAIIGMLSAGDEARPDLALVDIGMPMISGFEVARQLIGHGIPTIMMSALVTPGRVDQAREVGALDLLAKPDDAAGYTAMARRVLELVRGKGKPQ